MENLTNPIVPVTTVPGETGKKNTVPRADIDLGSLCRMVGQHWQKNKWLTLQWLTVDKFVDSAAVYNGLLTDKTVQGSSRPQITGYLRQLDKQINSSIEFVKNYLIDKYGREEAPNFYAAFGIVHTGNIYIIPKHRNDRQESLAQMQKGIVQEGFIKNTYGKTYWDNIKQQFDGYVNQAKLTDSGVSEKTGNKNMLKKDLKTGLEALVHAIKANCPYNWKTELRDWGFQKEKY